MEGTNFKDFKAEMLKRPGVRRQYHALQPRFDIIQAIIARRNELSISQRDLAKMIGMQQPAIARLERGDQNIRVGTLLRVADALNMHLDLHAREVDKEKVSY